MFCSFLSFSLSSSHSFSLSLIFLLSPSRSFSISRSLYTIKMNIKLSIKRLRKNPVDYRRAPQFAHPSRARRYLWNLRATTDVFNDGGAIYAYHFSFLTFSLPLSLGFPIDEHEVKRKCVCCLSREDSGAPRRSVGTVSVL